MAGPGVGSQWTGRDGGRGAVEINRRVAIDVGSDLIPRNAGDALDFQHPLRRNTPPLRYSLRLYPELARKGTRTACGSNDLISG